MRPPTPKAPPSRRLDGDLVLAADEIAALGLEEAPADSGASWQEIRLARQAKEVGNG